MINPGYVVGVADPQSMARSALDKKTFAVNEEIRVLRVRLDTGPPWLDRVGTRSQHYTLHSAKSVQSTRTTFVAEVTSRTAKEVFGVE